MNGRIAMRAQRHPHRPGFGMRGFTLVELMIAMLLGLIVIAGVTSVFLAGQQSFRTNSALADVQDSSRIAFELMARDIREAGLTGCNNGKNSTNYTVTNVSAAFTGATPPPWWSDWGNVVRGYASGGADPALSGITGDGAQVASTESLQLLSAASSPVVIQSNDPAAYTFTLNAATTDLSNGDLVMVCSPSHAAILRIGYPGVTTVNYNIAGNSATDLAYPKDTYILGTTPAPPVPYPFPPNSLVSRVSAADWYIGTNPDGGTSLYRRALQNVAGVLTPVSQEMVRNVTGMRITYLDPSAPGIDNQFVDAATIDTSGSWGDVTAVRVELTAESAFQRADVTGSQPVQRTYAFTTTLRNRLN